MTKLPKTVTKFFWGDDLKSLSFTKNKTYIIRKLLDIGDLPALRWLFKNIDKKEAKKALSPKMRKKSLNFWQMYLS